MTDRTIPERPSLDPRVVAAIELMRRCGGQAFRIGYTDDDDGPPTVWHATAAFVGDRHEVAAALDPVTATLRLCERVVDGGRCTHCGQMTIFVADMDTSLVDQMSCVYAWDPELETYRRGCEGDDR